MNKGTFLFGAALFAALVSPAQAQPTSTGLDCNAGNVMTTGFAPDAIACSGAWVGNDLPTAALLSQLSTDFADETGGSTFSFVGKSDDANGGPFTLNPEATSGVLSFDTPLSGFFAVSLKAANAFSVYLFNGGTTGIDSLSFSTLATSLNQNGMPQGLSHASLFTVTPPIPEPETYAMMLAGLGALGTILRRRRA
jgi:hypothetical protein